MAYSRDQLAQLVAEYANGYGINPAIALAQIRRESAGFRSDVVYGPFVGGAGERGVAQFTPATWADWGAGDPYDPDASLKAWGDYMTWLLQRYGGDYNRALMAYNGGPGNVDRNTVSSAAQRYAREVLAAAGQSAGSGGGNPSDPFNPINDPPQPQSSYLTPLLLLGGALVLIVLLSD